MKAGCMNEGCMNGDCMEKKWKKAAADIAREGQPVFEKISDYIFRHPELGGEERESSRYLAEVLSSYGFNVTFPYEDLPTAFIAECKRGEGARIGFLAEYDALPGYECCGGNAHACGHNWIAASMCGCGITLAELMKEENGPKGTIIVFGTPAEETFGGKVVMAAKGAFQNVDVAFQAHLNECSIIETRALAMNSIEFTYKGRPAHAASAPENGINALDGVQILFAGINALRQHVTSDVRIHGIITEGGTAVNIVPEKAVCRFTMRANTKSYLKYVRKRVEECARGAALISGAELSMRDFEYPFDDMVTVPALVELTKENFAKVGVTDFKDGIAAGSPGSTDLGNVSYICPTLYVELDPEAGIPFRVHEEEAIECVNSSFAYRKMQQTIFAFTDTALDLMADPEKLSLIKHQHQELTAKRTLGI